MPGRSSHRWSRRRVGPIATVKGPAEVLVFPFVREDGKDSRMWVYKDKDAIRFTDEVLDEAPKMAESDVAHGSMLLSHAGANRHLTSLQSFERPRGGSGRYSPRTSRSRTICPGLDVFIPGAERFLPVGISISLASSVWRRLSSSRPLSRPWARRGFLQGSPAPIGAVASVPGGCSETLASTIAHHHGASGHWSSTIPDNTARRPGWLTCSPRTTTIVQPSS